MHPLASLTALTPVTLLGVSLPICLLASSLGFKRTVYFVSLGYAAAIALQALVFAVLFRATCAGWPLAQVVLLFAYGTRLGVFVMNRDRNPTYRQPLAESEAHASTTAELVKFGIWAGVAGLYVLLFLPALATLSAQAGRQPLGSVPYGVLMMAIGLGIEAVADWQKSRFKGREPGHFCNVGMYRVCRHPNYFGEMLFWLGLWVSGVSAYHGSIVWALGSLGLIGIESVMIGATVRLESRQSKRYAGDHRYRAYVRSVPVLLPGIPLYSLRHPSTVVG